MADGIKAVEMTPGEHAYTIELDGRYVVFRDRGEFGKLDEGVDVFEFLPESRDGEDAGEGNYVYVDEMVADYYGPAIRRGMEGFQRDVDEAIKRVITIAERGPKSPFRMDSKYINLNFNYWCGRTSDREPYSQDISLGGGIFISDYSGDDTTDEAIFFTAGGARVVVRSYEYGPEQRMWNGSIEPCWDVDPTRYGLEQYLGRFDSLFTSGILRREL